ncbi:hypothetical protein D3C86_1212410 [compost metagenome]
MIVDKARRADLGLVDRQADPGETDRLGEVVENDLAGGGNDKGDFIKGGGKSHREVTAIVHATKTDTFVPAVDPADDDVFRRRRRVGIEVAEQVREQRAKVVAAHVVGPDDDLLARRACVHLKCHLERMGKALVQGTGRSEIERMRFGKALGRYQ